MVGFGNQFESKVEFIMSKPLQQAQKLRGDIILPCLACSKQPAPELGRDGVSYIVLEQTSRPAASAPLLQIWCSSAPDFWAIFAARPGGLGTLSRSRVCSLYVQVRTLEYVLASLAS